MGDWPGTILFLFIISIIVILLLARWIFKINHIVKQMDKIVHILEGKPAVAPERPKSFIDGFKKGYDG